MTNNEVRFWEKVKEMLKNYLETAEKMDTSKMDIGSIIQFLDDIRFDIDIILDEIFEPLKEIFGKKERR